MHTHTVTPHPNTHVMQIQICKHSHTPNTHPVNIHTCTDTHIHDLRSVISFLQLFAGCPADLIACQSLTSVPHLRVHSVAVSGYKSAANDLVLFHCYYLSYGSTYVFTCACILVLVSVCLLVLCCTNKRRVDFILTNYSHIALSRTHCHSERLCYV